MADQQYQLEGNAPQLFERDNAQTLGKPLAEQIFSHVELYDGDRVLDAACGTGILTRVAAQRFAHVDRLVGVDRNTGMLDGACVSRLAWAFTLSGEHAGHRHHGLYRVAPAPRHHMACMVHRMSKETTH